MVEERKTQEWVPMNYAARELGVPLPRLSQMAFNGKLEVRRDPRDARKRLVDLVALRKHFGAVPK